MIRPDAELLLEINDLHASVDDHPILKGVNLQVRAGEIHAVMGRNGSGKSTLLHSLGGLMRPTFGDVFLLGNRLRDMNPRQLGNARNQHLGFIYQFHHLLAEFNALENVAMPLLIRGIDSDAARNQARTMLDRVGLGHRIAHKPSELSGGERPRAAVARALVTMPALVLADEPTGNLDTKTARSVQDLMFELAAQDGHALLVATHDVDFAKRFEMKVELSDGKLHATA